MKKPNPENVRPIKKPDYTPEEKQRQRLFKEYLSVEKYGLSPYNAAIRAGYPEKVAVKMTLLDVKDEKGRPDLNYVVQNIYEQEGYTARRAIRRMVQKAGLAWDGEGAAKKIISATVVMTGSEDPTVRPLKANGLTKDFIEVDDEDVQFKYITKLNEMFGLAKQEGDGAGGHPPYNIEITIIAAVGSANIAAGSAAHPGAPGVEVRQI